MGQIIKVARHRLEGTKAVPLSGVLLEGIDGIAADLGLGRDRLLQLVRGIVFVEGVTDQHVLRALAGDVLDRHRLVTIPLGGHSAAAGVAHGELALALGLPVAVLFDEISRADIEALERDSNAKVSDEARSAWKLLQQRRRGLNCAVIPFEAGDICAALPEQAVRAGYPLFKGWDSVARTQGRNPGISFKHAFLDTLQVSRKKDTEMIMSLADRWDGRAALPAVFRRAIAALDAWGDSLSHLAGEPVPGSDPI